MNLLLFAHKKEAASFIKNEQFLQAKESTKKMYFNGKKMLLITGQGLRNVQKTLSEFFRQNKYAVDRIFNFGIAGALHEELTEKEVYPVSFSCYKQNNNINIERLNTQVAGKSCLTVDEPIFDRTKKMHLRCHADLIDMELWGIASFINGMPIALEAYKLISDTAENPEDIPEIRKKAHEYSEIMYTYYKLNVKERNDLV